jgi:glycosyltransferase involved in cell wall biosynthesis
MRILFVAFPGSIHTARWISQISDQGWELGLFSSHLARFHPDLRNLSIWGTRWFRGGTADPSVHRKRWADVYFHLDWALSLLFRKPIHLFKGKALIRAINEFQPDIVHSLELQHAGYLTLGARKAMGRSFPAWIVTNWGSDIYYFGRFPEHRAILRELLGLCDDYTCECERDVRLAREMGFRGTTMHVIPNAGGFSIEEVGKYRRSGNVSDRKTITVKGYQGWSGRVLVALEAIRRNRELLQGYQVVVYSASGEVEAAARTLEKETGIPVLIRPRSLHEDILRLFGRSRLYVGLSISDGISTSMLEAMAMGAFPIQSCTACADEWIMDGKSGLIVPPEDPEVVAQAIRRALTDDALVDQAADINEAVVRERLDASVIQPQVIKLYEDIFRDRKG